MEHTVPIDGILYYYHYYYYYYYFFWSTDHTLSFSPEIYGRIQGPCPHRAEKSLRAPCPPAQNRPIQQILRKDSPLEIPEKAHGSSLWQDACITFSLVNILSAHYEGGPEGLFYR